MSNWKKRALQAGALLVAVWLVFALCVPKRAHVNRLLTRHFPGYLVTVVSAEENHEDNTALWNTLDHRGKLKILKNYVRFHSLPKKQQLKIMTNYLDWLRYDEDDKTQAIRKYRQIHPCRSTGTGCKPQGGNSHLLYQKVSTAPADSNGRTENGR
jgi:hypothetical protein